MKKLTGVMLGWGIMALLLGCLRRNAGDAAQPEYRAPGALLGSRRPPRHPGGGDVLRFTDSLPVSLPAGRA